MQTFGAIFANYASYWFSRFSPGTPWTGRRFRWLIWLGGGGMIAIAIGALLV